MKKKEFLGYEIKENIEGKKTTLTLKKWIKPRESCGVKKDLISLDIELEMKMSDIGYVTITGILDSEFNETPNEFKTLYKDVKADIWKSSKRDPNMKSQYHSGNFMIEFQASIPNMVDYSIIKEYLKKIK